MKKIKIPLIILWLILGGCFVYWLNIPHWRVYKDTQCGFSISLPKDFQVKNSPYSYSVPKPCDLDFAILDKNDLEYFRVWSYDIPKDYEKPTGPFPKITSNEKGGSSVSPYVFNGINGFRTHGGFEGGGGSFDEFEFVHNGKVWDVAFSAEEGNYSIQSYDMKVYTKIRDSFILNN